MSRDDLLGYESRLPVGGGEGARGNVVGESPSSLGTGRQIVVFDARGQPVPLVGRDADGATSLVRRYMRMVVAKFEDIFLEF
jgi:hypothetical protein